MADSNEKRKEEILLSKRMFFAGCFGLPWLWICNALYFRLQVFGPLVLVDYWPGQKPPSSPSFEEEGANDDDDDDGGNNNNNSTDQQQAAMDQQMEQETKQKELVTWVKRSTRGAALVMTLFVAWIITFQVNKSNFGSKWFVMDETDAARTGW
mmetsp:Transcript_22760/g.40775  ORF Transcript_22760/g.40775 Transcript_22760/m.40775 type:complete len:153 (-) Transcript_22760:296-754(-)|eukprot:CAMPEP_0201885094 /NCGR_PEP_ID=MMETSP0902-20130614/17884_1 /ASSEMBLY_ACC=CAM_ASM_000551 /TAXON_ID=420261 /ORGANISM="Thalassiosira antarctica, Strain CCMP982" /LENGTH=152 /DNA_ID=CAMNT_0048414151 /DNA_START=333 /DNA_END=791 /DNA_ORIENTATION=-